MEIRRRLDGYGGRPRTVATGFSDRGTYRSGMSDADPDVTELLTDLTRSLQELQREMEPDRRSRPPTQRTLSQFTSEVAIPGLILLLQTNIRALQLLQRTIRLAEGREPTDRSSTTSEARDRAEQLGRATLTQLDDTLSEVQSALEGRPADDETRELLSDARQLRDEIQSELADGDGDGGSAGDGDEGPVDREGDTVDIDVESELQSIKSNLEDDDGDDGDQSPGSAGSDGNGRPDDAAGSGGEGHSDDTGGPDRD
jgi:hypothetical protein